jgi:hypothetical protein
VSSVPWFGAEPSACYRVWPCTARPRGQFIARCLCSRGGIGRRVRLRTVWGNPWRFESSREQFTFGATRCATVVSARGHITIFAINTLIGGLLGAAKIPGESSPSLGVGSDRGSLVQRAKFCPSKKQDPQARRDVSRAIRACDHGLRTDLQRVGYNAEHGFKKLDDGPTRFAKSAKEFTLGTKLGQPVGNCAARSKLHL